MSTNIIKWISAMLRSYVAIVVFNLLTMSSVALAQGEPTPSLPHRGVFSQLPFERIDTATGALALTFTDLVLPGPAGRDLRFQRTLHAPSRWKFGLAGYVLYVTEPGMPPVGTAPETAELQYTPQLIDASGAIHKMYVVGQMDTSSEALINYTFNVVTTEHFWRFHRAAQELYLPDGTTCRYETATPSSKRLKQCFAPHGAEELSIEWGVTGAPTTITQILGNQRRTVAVSGLSESSRLPSELTFMGNTWTYEWGNPARVIPPTGPRWQVSRLGLTLLPSTVVVKTPHGGEIEYSLDNHPSEDAAIVTKRSLLDRGETQPRDWNFSYNFTNNTAVVDTPTVGTQLVYGHDTAGKRLLSRELRVNQAVVETETRTYIGVPVVKYPNETIHLSASAIASSSVVTDGRTYLTVYDYQDEPYSVGTGCGPQHRYADFHRPWRVTEETKDGDVVVRRRVTERTYKHCDTGTRLSVGHVSREQVTADGGTAISTWDVDPNSGIVSSQTVDGVTTNFSGHYLGQPGLVTDGNNNSASIQYDWGLPNVIATSKIRVEREISPNGTLKAETTGAGTPNARRTEYEYDAAFRPVKIRPAEGRRQTTIEYDPAGTWTRVTRGTSKLTTTVDGFGRPIKSEDAMGQSRTVKYDADGRVIFHGYPVAAGGTAIGVTVGYDERGRIVQLTNPDEDLDAGHSSHSSITYGPGTVTITDEEGRSSVRHVELLGNDARLMKLTDAAAKHWTYEYNVLGALTKMTAPDGTQRSWTYDTAEGSTTSRVKTETHPESGLTSYSYDAAGNLKTKTDAKGQILTLTYDANNRVEKVTADSAGANPEETTIEYEVGSNSRSRVTVGGTTVTYLYDRAGRHDGYVATIDGRRFDVRYDFDADDNVTNITYPTLRRVAYEFDNEHRVTTVRDVLSGVEYASGVGYHPSGATTGYTAGNGIPFSFSYNPKRYWPTAIQSGPLHLTYGSYDRVGNVTAIDDARGSSWNQAFQYDALDRLTLSNGGYGSIGYGYNDHGNMTSMGTSTFTYDAGTLRMATQNGQSIAYDANGNVQSGLTAGSFTYTPKNQVATATVSGTTTAYTYDGDELRIKKSSPSGTTFYLRAPNGEVLTEILITAGGAEHFWDFIYAGNRVIAVVKR